jgi:putative aminopeptidase FrvX
MGLAGLDREREGTDLEVIPLLKSLSEAVGLSGYEDEVRDLVSKELGRYADEVRHDKLGNVIALKRGSEDGEGPRRRIMLAAHMDEVGLIVSQVEKGFLHVATVGGLDARMLPGQEVIVHGRRPLPGLVASRPPHLLSPDERKKTVPLQDLFVDVGLAADEIGDVVRVGDLISLARPFTTLAGDVVSGKAFDDRASVAALVVCLEALTRLRHRWDVYAVATVQEEVGLRGAVTSAYGLTPDVGIAIDVNFARQPGTSEVETVEMGKGPSIALGPNIHPLVYETLVATAEKVEIPYQLEAAPGGTGTDAWAIQVTRAGVPTGLLSIAVRNMHTPVEIVNVKDIARAGRLLAEFIAVLDEEFAAGLLTPLEKITNDT